MYDERYGRCDTAMYIILIKFTIKINQTIHITSKGTLWLNPSECPDVFSTMYLMSQLAQSQSLVPTLSTFNPIADEPTGTTPVVTPNRSIQAPAVAGITVGVIIGMAVLLLIVAATVGFAMLWWSYRRRKVVELEPHMSFATKDYTDEATVSELDDMAD